MSSISAGTTIGTALVSTGDTTGQLDLKINGTTQAVRINTSGAIGVGTSPSYGTSGQVLTSGGSSAAPSWSTVAAFDSGTLMLFQQTAAPTGWTKQTTHNNKALRVVSGSASSGGTSSFTTVFTDQTPTINTSGLSAGATTLSTTQIPSHSHSVPCGNAGGGGGGILRPDDVSVNTSVSSGSTGGGSSHSHSISGSATSSAITLAVQYVDLIIASKD